MAKPGVPSAGTGEYAPLPEMTFILCKIAETSIEMKAFKDEEAKPQLKVVLDAVSYVDEDGDKIDASGSRVWFFGGVSLHEKAKLRPLALAVMPEDTTTDVLTDEQKADPKRKPNLFEDFDTDMLEGKYVYVIGTDPDKTGYLKPTGWKRVKTQPKADAAAPAPKADKKKLADAAVEI